MSETSLTCPYMQIYCKYVYSKGINNNDEYLLQPLDASVKDTGVQGDFTIEIDNLSI